MREGGEPMKSVENEMLWPHSSLIWAVLGGNSLEGDPLEPLGVKERT